ncbi:unnamed protein product [Nezara viridula]|uniref:Uncharacterized protein n=1 Tax=Nezara viridula TaxID=85310 RepID=A0A9P0EDU2_NEZVI|nr:unnamed protein product [Nezara viridula]
MFINTAFWASFIVAVESHSFSVASAVYFGISPLLEITKALTVTLFMTHVHARTISPESTEKVKLEGVKGLKVRKREGEDKKKSVREECNLTGLESKDLGHLIQSAGPFLPAANPMTSA